MPTYRVGVRLNLKASGYTTSLAGAGARTQRFGGVVNRTAGRATAALRGVAGAAAGVGSALTRTAGAARRVGTASRRMADAFGASIGSVRRRVDGLIGRMRALRAAGRQAGGSLGGGIGRLAGAAGGVYGAVRVVTGESALDQRYTDLAVKAGLSRAEQADLQRRVEAAAQAAQIQRGKLLDAAAKEYELSGDIGPILEDLPATARVLRIDPGTSGADLGAVRAQFKNFDLDTPELRERAMFQGLQAAMTGALSFADLARSGGEAMAAQTEIFGNRDWESFLVASQQVMTGFMKAEPTMTAYTAFLKILSLEREELTKLIGQVEAGANPIDVAKRLVASVGGDIANLKGTPFGTQETLGALAGLVGRKGQALGAQVEPAIAVSREELWANLEPVWQRQAETPAAAIEVAQDLAQRDTGGVLMRLWRPATTALVRHLPKIELGIVGLAAAYGAVRLVGAAGRGIRWWRGGSGGAPGVGGGPAGAGLSTVATMRVGTLIVSSMPGGGAGGSRTILGPDGRPVRSAPGSGGSAAGGRGGSPTRGRGGLVGRLGGLSRRMPYLGLALGGIGVGTELMQGNLRGAAQQSGGVAGGWGGAVAGAAAGAALGSFVPLIGTTIGATIGGLIGALSGNVIGDAVSGEILNAFGEVDADETRRSVRGRTRQRELDERDVPPAVELRPASRGVVNVHNEFPDHSRVEITVQAADDPHATGEAVADAVASRAERRRRQRERRIRDTVMDDLPPDAAF